MKVTFATPYFPPEVGAAQTRIQELAWRLSQLGHHVSVLTTFPSYPSGIVPVEWRGQIYWKGQAAGVTIYRVWSYAAPNRGFFKRVISHLTYAFSASLFGLFLTRQDVLIVESPPLFDGFIGVLIRLLRRTPYLFNVSDLWPESAIQMGMLKNRILIWVSRQIEQLFYRQAAAVLAMTRGIQRRIVADGIDKSKVVSFRNSVDCEFFSPSLNVSRIREEIGVDDSEFIALYAGTFGLAQNLSTVLKAAALAQAEPGCRVRFVLAGTGPESDALQQIAREWRLSNVTFLSPLPKARIPELINSADCILVPLRDLQIFRGALPTKMFEAMACAKPVVLSIEGEAADLLCEAKAGLCVAPEDPTAILDAITTLIRDPNRAQELGCSGRRYVMQNFSRASRARQLDEIISTSCGAASSPDSQSIRDSEPIHEQVAS
ncbi:MAG: glycosyltransferase WbuB [Candidatus Angelobacter sp.]|jgi:glycosyltransferase involved in cell wall biosynthesis|nr:glycosyltransferase WbuB [Candidatus Angelobacter sp.]